MEAKSNGGENDLSIHGHRHTNTKPNHANRWSRRNQAHILKGVGSEGGSDRPQGSHTRIHTRH